MPSMTLEINGQKKQVEIDPEMPLLWVLRDVLGMTGTKYSCGKGLCGSCMVHRDGQAVRSCSLAASTFAGTKITTIEGLAPDRGHALQKAWIAEEVPQCGWCQSGQIMAAAALLAAKPKPTDAEIDTAMNCVLCRCGTYERIRRAIHRAAGQTTREGQP